MKKFIHALFTRHKDLTVEERVIKRTTWSFTAFVILIVLAVVSWQYLRDQPPPEGERGIQKPVREVLDFNALIFDGLLDDDHLSETYPKEMAVEEARINGLHGLKSELNEEEWRLTIEKSDGSYLHLTLEDIKKLPKTEYTFNFKCIEGWSEISNWGGVRFSEFASHYGLEAEISKAYMGLFTPDSTYYVGIDMPSALHPQTLLCYEHNRKPLSLAHGYPLRLMIPVKYGVKSLKRIGTMYFSDSRPPDYWAERGYDYYIGL